MIEEKILRYAAPVLYKRMGEIISAHHIHPYDVQAFVIKKEGGMDVHLRFSADFSQSITFFISHEQAENPDDRVTEFFEQAAEKCKSLIIANYYKMMKL